MRLGHRLLGKVVSVEVTDVDRCGREVGIVTLPDGPILHRALLEAGLPT